MNSRSKPTVVVTRRWPSIVEATLRESYDVVFDDADVPLSHAELCAAMRSADALCPTVTDDITADIILDEAAKVKIIANFGVGVNHIDLEAAKSSGLAVTNTPDVLTDCTADLTLALMLGVARRVGEGERQLRENAWAGWRPTHMMGTQVTGKTLGLIGFGRIAQAVAHRAHRGFGMRILFYNPSAPAREVVESVAAERCGSVEALLRQSDFVSLHCPGGANTHHLIDRARLAEMPSHAYLINTARGSVVDEAALTEALSEGRIRGAGLDVFTNEPSIPEALRSLDNVMLLPHLGSATQETRVAMGMRVVENLHAYFNNQPLPDRVV